MSALPRCCRPLCSYGVVLQRVNRLTRFLQTDAGGDDLATANPTPARKRKKVTTAKKQTGINDELKVFTFIVS